MLLTLQACAFACHVVNTIKGGSRPLFIIGNAYFKLTTPVLFCLPQVKECSVLLLLITKQMHLIDN